MRLKLKSLLLSEFRAAVPSSWNSLPGVRYSIEALPQGLAVLPWRRPRIIEDGAYQVPKKRERR